MDLTCGAGKVSAGPASSYAYDFTDLLFAGIFRRAFFQQCIYVMLKPCCLSSNFQQVKITTNCSLRRK